MITLITLNPHPPIMGRCILLPGEERRKGHIPEVGRRIQLGEAEPRKEGIPPEVGRRIREAGCRIPPEVGRRIREAGRRIPPEVGRRIREVVRHKGRRHVQQQQVRIP